MPSSAGRAAGRVAATGSSAGQVRLEEIGQGAHVQRRPSDRRRRPAGSRSPARRAGRVASMSRKPPSTDQRPERRTRWPRTEPGDHGVRARRDRRCATPLCVEAPRRPRPSRSGASKSTSLEDAVDHGATSAPPGMSASPSVTDRAAGRVRASALGPAGWPAAPPPRPRSAAARARCRSPAGRGAALVMLEYETRRHPMSRSRSKRAASSAGDAPRRGATGRPRGSPTRSTDDVLARARRRPTTIVARRCARRGAVRQRRARRVAVEEQARQRRVLAVLRAGPPQHRLVPGPRQGDVEQAKVLAAALLELQLLVDGESRSRRGRRRWCARCRRRGRGRPGPRSDWPRPSQTKGQNTTGNSRPLLRWIVMTCTASASDSSRRARSSFSASRVGVVDAPAQPGGHGRRAEALGHAGLVEQLGNVTQVGHEALPRRLGRAHAPGTSWALLTVS